MRSKADENEMASLIERTARKLKNKEKIKSKGKNAIKNHSHIANIICSSDL